VNNPHIKLVGQPVPTSPNDSHRIRYAFYDWGPCVFNHREAWWCFNGKWKPINVAEAVCKAGLLSEERYHRMFPDAPPLPMHAFCRDGWRSPLA
jgi:hypothetical protein